MPRSKSVCPPGRDNPGRGVGDENRGVLQRRTNVLRDFAQAVRKFSRFFAFFAKTCSLFPNFLKKFSPPRPMQKPAKTGEFPPPSAKKPPKTAKKRRKPGTSGSAAVSGTFGGGTRFSPPPPVSGQRLASIPGLGFGLRSAFSPWSQGLGEGLASVPALDRGPPSDQGWAPGCFGFEELREKGGVAGRGTSTARDWHKAGDLQQKGRKFTKKGTAAGNPLGYSGCGGRGDLR